MTEKMVYAFSEGNKDLKDLLGGKGANLAEMTNLGLPVPPGFTITTEACRDYLVTGAMSKDLLSQVRSSLDALEEQMGRTLGDPENPLLLSVRSGAKFSMPGMMETVLNIGLNDESVHGLAAQSGNDRFAWDSYRRLIQMFGKTVLDLDGELFADALAEVMVESGVSSDVQIPADALKGLVKRYEDIITSHGMHFPQDPRDQLLGAIEAVFRSWNTPRAQLYRRQERIPNDLGTAVNVQAMVFGNSGEHSGTGVAFTRDPATGAPGVYGDYLESAQGEDVVSGIRNTLALSDLAELEPGPYAELMEIMTTLENHYRDLCDIEFTIERGKLWMLQTRVGKRTAAAAFRIAVQLVDEGLIDMDEAVRRVSGPQLGMLMFPQFDHAHAPKSAAKGTAASPGAAVGKIVFDSEAAVAAAAEGKQVILVRRETNPDDLPGMVAAAGILTTRGGKTSHAAVVARGMGKTAVCGTESIEIDSVARTLTFPDGKRLVEGQVISIDGSTGEVFDGEVEVRPSPVVEYFDAGIDAALDDADAATTDLVNAVDRIMRHSDENRRLLVRANADTPEDAARGRRMGSQGIGLCRTEHMFLGDRKQYVEKLILAESDEEREEALAELLPLQRKDFIRILEVMDGLPVTIRLLDPPLHEFLPDLTELSVRVAVAEEQGKPNEADLRLLRAVRRLHESNPMLGLRGVRLGLVVQGLFALQVRAIAEAACFRQRLGGDPQAEIMIPLVGSVHELELIIDEASQVLADVASKHGCTLRFPIGTMIELPRAALTAGEIAKSAEFFSFGTNDLTQTTWGFSRDDVEAGFFSLYLDKGVFGVSPFESIDEEGVGRLVSIASTEGREVRPDLHLGVCGEHGGDPQSVHFFHNVGLDYVSCSPFRVPVARLEAARASLGMTSSDMR
ncbi:MAG: pyruvate, phosphate dikinase [Candidatus Nanopelagicales bacterium]|nr:pyruvate, phosphate dikinase [Actinomycetota bacterium]HNO15109.1 pyruvate, phosphate dikinase [Actinomycetota bacterium]HUM86502.1 pyruvate, phosphate dikinase [Actinomycetota bacterium]